VINEMLFIKRLKLNILRVHVTLKTHTKALVMASFTCKVAIRIVEIN